MSNTSFYVVLSFGIWKKGLFLNKKPLVSKKQPIFGRKWFWVSWIVYVLPVETLSATQCLASGEATRYSWKSACKQPSRLTSVIFPLFHRDITYSISLEAVTTLIVFLSCQLFHKEILRESIIHRYLMHGRWYVLLWGAAWGQNKHCWLLL